MNPFIGIVCQLAAGVSFTLMGALVRHVSPRVPLGEIVFFRSFIAILPLLVMLAWRNELILAVRTKNPLAHLSRSVSGILAMFLTFAALWYLPLAEATAIGFATPLFNVALAAFFLGEKVRIWRWSAVLIGLLGVLVMLSPYIGQQDYDRDDAIGALIALAAALVISVAMTQVRYFSRTETTASLVFYFSLSCAVGGLLTIPLGWIWPSNGDWMALIALGVFGGFGQILITESYRYAPASVLAPFAYFTMVWSVIIGYLAFSELPKQEVFVGAAIVIAAGLFVAYRERKLGIERTKERAAEGPPAGTAV
ncbi:MAG: DMT family transporter [Hyphomicrobium sp.]|nr:DMT family transporter [Hyphomicrobium sp.]